MRRSPGCTGCCFSCAMTSRECAGCMACGGSGHSHRTCVLLGAALHRRFLKLDSHKDMKDVVDVILRLLLWDWRETRVDGNISCLSYAPNCDIIAVGCKSGQLFFIEAETGENILCPVRCGGKVYSVQFSPDGQHIVAGCDDGVYIFSLNQQSRDWEIRSESPLRGHRYVPSLSREYFLSCF